MVEARALWFVSPGRVEVRTETVQPRPDEVLVESVLMGISRGTELLFYRGDFPRDLEADCPGMTERFAYPLKYGYSNVGRAGDDPDKLVFAFYPHQDRFFFPTADLLPVAPGLSPRDAIFIPQVETALSIAQDLSARPGEALLVVGAGVVGLLLAEVLKRSHWGRVVVADVDDGKRRVVEELGAAFANPNRREERRELVGFDRGVNLSGTGDGLQLLLDSLGREGVAVEASWHGDRPVTLNLGNAFHRRRLTIKSSQVSTISGEFSPRWTKPRRLAAAQRLALEITPSRYLAGTYRLEAAPEAFRRLSEEPVLALALEP